MHSRKYRTAQGNNSGQSLTCILATANDSEVSTATDIDLADAQAIRVRMCRYFHNLSDDKLVTQFTGLLYRSDFQSRHGQPVSQLRSIQPG